MHDTLPDHYAVLGVARDATRQEIARAYRTQMRVFHSDSASEAESPEARAALDDLGKEISAAFNTLNNPEKRAEYDRQLGLGDPQSPPSPPGAQPRRTAPKVDLADAPPSRDVRSGPDFTVDPAGWSWYQAAPQSPDTDKPPVRSGAARWALRALAVAAWVAWIYPSMVGWGIPVRIGAGGGAMALDTTTFLAVGVIVHLALGALVLTGKVFSKWGIPIPVALIASAFLVESARMDGLLSGVALWMARLGPAAAAAGSLGLALLALLATVGLGSRAERKNRRFLDQTSFVQVGAQSVGARHPDLDILVGTLTGAFGHRKGVRMFLLPERMEVAPGASVRSQVVISTGSDVHLVAMPLIGRRGVQVQGNQLEADGSAHRNVVLDETAALSRSLKGMRVHGHIVLPMMSSPPAEPVELEGITYGTFDQILDRVGSLSAKQLDQVSPSAHLRVFESLGKIV